MQAGEVSVEDDDVVGVDVRLDGPLEAVVGDVDSEPLVAQTLDDIVS
jgi:hypothetical protein